MRHAFGRGWPQRSGQQRSCSARVGPPRRRPRRVPSRPRLGRRMPRHRRTLPRAAIRGRPISRSWTSRSGGSIRRRSRSIPKPSGPRDSPSSRASLPAAAPDEQLVQLASLVGLLDTHSYLDWRPGAKFYEVLLYQFSDGIYAIRAADPSLVGARLVSINGVPVAEVTKRLAPSCPMTTRVVSSTGIQGLYLLGRVPPRRRDRRRPAEARVRLPATGGEWPWSTRARSGWTVGSSELGIVGDLMGDKPEAVARRTEPVWWRVETKSPGLPPGLQRLRRSDRRHSPR